MLDINKQENLSLTPLDFSPVRMNMDKIPEERIDIICSQIVNYANSLQIMTTADLKDLSPDCIDQELRHNFIDAIYNGNMNSALRIVDEQIDLLIELHEMLEERKTQLAVNHYYERFVALPLVENFYLVRAIG